MAFTQEMRTAGSKKGYYADIDNSSSSSSDDDASSSRSVKGYCIPSSETTVSAAASTEGASSSSSSSFLPSQFYKDVQPRRRRQSRCQRHQQFKNITRQTQQDATHPDIDLSLVSLLTSREHDRRQFKKLQKALRLHHRGNITLPERLQRHSSSHHHKPKNNTCHQVNKDAIEDESFSSSSSPSSSSESDRYCNNIIKTEHEYSKALSKPPKNNRPIAVIDYGSVQFGQLGSVLDSIYKIGGEEEGGAADGDKSKRRSFGGGDAAFLVDSHDVKSAANFSTPHQPALTVASSRSSDVAAVIASLKNPSADLKRKAHYEDCSSAKKIKFLPPTTVVHKTDTTTLEDAVAFSPYARVLFTADFPQTVVHINAAYCALVKKGFAKPCALGHPLTTTNIERRSYEDSSKLNGESAAKIVSNDLGISTKDINYQLFPIISGDESFCDYSRTHCSYELGEAAEEGEGDHVHRHVSHYLLQIEPVALS